METVNAMNGGWIRILPYHEFIFERKLMARFKTNFDTFDFQMSTKKNSTLQAYALAKANFFKSIKD